MNQLSDIAAVWQAFVTQGHTDSALISPPMLRSWQRCRALPLDAIAPVASGPVDESFDHVLAGLRDLTRPSMEDLYQFVEGSGFVVLLFTAELRLIDLLGDPPIVDQLAALGLATGTRWSERRIGTMAVNLALAEAVPCQTRGAEHYHRAYHQLTCSAAPLFDVEGRALGVLGVLGPTSAAHAHTLGMTIATAQAIHSQLRANVLLAETNDHLAELNVVIEAISEGILVVDAKGQLSRMNARAAQMLGLTQRGAAGHMLEALLPLPQNLRAALERRQEQTDQEMLFESRKGPVAALVSQRPLWERGRHYRGALITLRPPESVKRLVQRFTGAQASFTFADILGESPRMQAALRHTRIAAFSPTPVLLEGEAGVGKKLFAHALHNAGARADGPFVVLNCAAVPRSLLLGELIGYESQADNQPSAESRPGRLELAQGGTLLLAEASALSPEAQTNLLRAIETGHLIRIGGRRVVPLDVRIITTTSGDLQADVAEGRFRADLLYRLSVLSIQIPPLRQRGDDVLLLISHMLTALHQRLGKQTLLSPEALAALCAYPWPGNVRELESTIERLLYLSEKSVLALDDLPISITRHTSADHATPPRLYDRQALAEREAILRTCRETGGHLGRAAERLGISRATLWRKMKQLGIERKQLWNS
ncbi:MAG: sigma 54-interacting transcriptional regulator [Roseiflexaceae bacterium]|nr:sigma 54-interacting transcriptional regulator [Roseiflexaceae bacterium]